MLAKLIPAYKSYLWGGTKLKKEFGKCFDSDILAETWELSCHKDGLSVLEDSGETLQDYLTSHPKEMGTACSRFSEFPLLIKLIDAADNLSIQVHPNNEYAKKHEGQLGKTEVWYIVDCEQDAAIYYGVQKEMTPEDFAKAIENNTVCNVLRRVPVKKGEVYFIEAGTIHAIGKGIVIAEIQQSSNITYRVYDYDRRDMNGNARQLHIEKACEVANLFPSKNHNFGKHIAKCDYFVVDDVHVVGEYSGIADEVSFHSLLILDGECIISNQNTRITATKGDSIFVGAESGQYIVNGNCHMLLTRVPKPNYRVGVDLGGTNIKVGVVDSANQIVATHKCKTLVERPWGEVVTDMAIAVQKACEKCGISVTDCKSVGVGSPGVVSAEDGVVIYSNNFPGWENIPLGAALSNQLGVPVHVSNDANCAALGEYVAGSAKGKNSAVLITLGTGVGGGVVFDGKIFEGGMAGGAELGHTTLISGGELCSCGRKGCFEAYCSATALIREAKRMAKLHQESLLNSLCQDNLDNMNGKIPFDAAEKGDIYAKQVVERYLELLGEGIVNMVNIFRPEVILISGGICDQGKVITEPLNTYVRTHAFAGERIAVPRVERAVLGNDAGIVGAANL